MLTNSLLLGHFPLFSQQSVFLLSCPNVFNMHVCVGLFSFSSEAVLRIRIKGEKAPELQLELQDDDRTNLFLTQLKSAQEEGKTSSCRQLIHYSAAHPTFIYKGWITLPSDVM